MNTRKRSVWEGLYKGEIATYSMDKLASIEGDLISICNNIKMVFGKDSDVFAKLNLLRTDCGKALDSLDNALREIEYEEPIKVSESRDDSGWFNEIGELTPPDWAIDEFGIDPEKSPLPDVCVRVCSHSGPVDDVVSAWVDVLKFDQNFPVKRARRWLKGYGAWDKEELAGMDARELAEKALWIFACDISDG